MVTGSGPQAKVMTPPLATASTNAAEVQLSFVPEPTTVVGLEVSSAFAPSGTAQAPAGLPAAGPVEGSVGGGGGTPGGFGSGLPGPPDDPSPSVLSSPHAATARTSPKPTAQPHCPPRIRTVSRRE